MLMQKERMINYLSGKGYKNKKARRIIEKEGAVEGLNVITVKKRSGSLKTKTLHKLGNSMLKKLQEETVKLWVSVFNGTV
jgi:hypothetical protein